MAKIQKKIKLPALKASDNIRAINAVLGAIEEKFGDAIDASPSCDNYVSTGSLIIDRTLGKGVPRGRIVEIYGEEASGKTTMAILMAIQMQKEFPNLYVAFIDLEHAFFLDYAIKLGFNPERLIFRQPSSAEEALELVLGLSGTSACSMIILDSIGALQTQRQLEKDVGEETVGEAARIMSQTLPKICAAASRTATTVVFINQLRAKIVRFGNPTTTMGGKALKFFASLRMEIKRTEVIMQNDYPIGQQIRVKVAKNKVGKPFGICDTILYFGVGFDPVTEVVDLCVQMNIIIQAGAWFKYGDKKVQGKPALVKYIKDNDQLFMELSSKVAQQEAPF